MIYRYTGDTRPCHALVDPGMNADILIHEATFEDVLIREAVSKYHSTISEAIEIAKQMKAKCLLLNHFSQRYPIVPVLSNSTNNDYNGIIAISFDMMCIPLEELQMLPEITEKMMTTCDTWKEEISQLLTFSQLDDI